MTLRAVKWSFDDGVIYPGFTDDTYWNGFLNVYVTPETRDLIVADIRAAIGDNQSSDDLAAIPIGKDGLVDLGNCYTAQEAEEEQ